MSIKFGPLLGSGLYEQGVGGGGSYTNEQAQDAVGTILTDSSSIDFTYDDAGNTITAVVLPAGVDHDALSNFFANEHIDHTAVSISAGAGLTGGGTIAATRTLAVSYGTGPAAIGTQANGSSDNVARIDHVHATPMTTTGDIMHYSGGTVARLALGTNGQVPKSDGSALAYGYPAMVPGVYREGFDDFLGNANNSGHSMAWVSTVSGTGAASARLNTEVGTFGVHGLDAGTTTTGRAGFNLGNVDFFCGIGKIDFYFKVKFAILADGTESYQCHWGMGDVVAAGDQLDGVYFQYDNTSGFLVIKSANNGTRTTTTTSFTMDTSWHIYRIASNAAGTSVDFYVDGTNYGTITTNLPTTAVRGSGPLAKIEKTAGTTSRIMYLDYFYYLGEF